MRNTILRSCYVLFLFISFLFSFLSCPFLPFCPLFRVYYIKTIRMVPAFSFVLPTSSSAPSRGVARVIWLLILWYRTVCFCLIFLVVHVTLFSLCYTFSARHFAPSRDCGLCHPSISCWFPPFRLAPRHDGGLREGFDVSFHCHGACVFLQFAFPRLAPPRHAGGSREVF